MLFSVALTAGSVMTSGMVTNLQSRRRSSGDVDQQEPPGEREIEEGRPEQHPGPVRGSLGGEPQPQDQQHCQLFGSILKQYLGDRFDRSAGSLTAADCLGLVETHTDDAQLARQMSDLVDVCEAAHYSTAQTDIDADQIVLAIRLIRDIHKQAKK